MIRREHRCRAMFAARKPSAQAIVVLAILFPLATEGALAGPGQGEETSAAAGAEEYDLVYLGPQGPVFLTLQISSGPRGVTAVRREYAEIVLRTLDSDGDGLLDAEEAGQIPHDGQLFASAETLGEDWKSLDVAPADDQISADELFAFVDENLGERFRVELKTRLQESVRLFSPLDADRDGLVSREEIEKGFRSLRAFDFDDDETLSVAELQPFPTSMLQARSQQPGDDAAQLPVIVLTTEAQRKEALDRIVSLYGVSGEEGKGRGIDLDRIGADQESLAVCDGDGDGRIDESELFDLLVDPPGLPVAVNISRSRVSVEEWEGYGPLVVERPRTERGRVNCLLAGMSVKLRALNDVQGGMSDAVAMQKFYLQRFTQFDQDKNRYLDMTEFASLELPDVQFVSVDGNGDDMVTRDELEAHLEVSASLSQSLIVLTISDEGKTLFDILDADEDNRLDPREFLEGYGKVRRQDLNRDGLLAAAELDSELQFTVALAKPEILRLRFAQPTMTAGARQPRIQEETSGPRWFRKMDRNLDGDLTWREFLGTREDFEQIDLDRDGLIDLDEAVAAE